MNSTTIFGEVCWYAVLTRSRQEKVAASMLDSLGIPNFLPLLSETRQWSDRKQVVNVPLFPGYLFVRLPKISELHLRVRKVPGIIHFVGNHNGPLAIPDAEIDGIRTVLSHRVPCTPCPVPQNGDRVRIVRGALAGIEGVLVRTGPDTNLVLSVEMIHQSIAVRVDCAEVEPVFRAPAAAIAAMAPVASLAHGY